MRVALGLLAFLAACGAQLGDGDPRAIRPDASHGADAARGPDAAVPLDAAAMVADNACGVASTQGDLGTLTGTAGSDPQSSTTSARVSFVTAATPGTAMQATPDFVYVQLWDGYGPFANGAAKPGTYTISGDETDYDTCGVCVLMLANVDANGTPAKMMLATSGTVMITSVGTAPGQTTQATIANASFTEITLNNQDYVNVPGSACTSPISHVQLSGTL